MILSPLFPKYFALLFLYRLHPSLFFPHHFYIVTTFLRNSSSIVVAMKPTNISPSKAESQDLINRPVIRESRSCPSTLLSLLVMLMKMSTRPNRKKTNDARRRWRINWASTINKWSCFNFSWAITSCDWSNLH